MGDYRVSTPLNVLTWAMNPGASSTADGTVFNLLPETDYDTVFRGVKWTGSPYITAIKKPGQASGSNSNNGSTILSGNLPSSNFAMAIDLETSNGLEISGLNAEEQSDISLIARYSDSQEPGFIFDVFTYIDAMIVLRENNVLELIE